MKILVLVLSFFCSSCKELKESKSKLIDQEHAMQCAIVSMSISQNMWRCSNRESVCYVLNGSGVSCFQVFEPIEHDLEY